jgi:hypothetical protein
MTSVLTRGQDINELQNEMAKNIGVVEQYFTMNKFAYKSVKRHITFFSIQNNIGWTVI